MKSYAQWKISYIEQVKKQTNLGFIFWDLQIKARGKQILEENKQVSVILH